MWRSSTLVLHTSCHSRRGLSKAYCILRASSLILVVAHEELSRNVYPMAEETVTELLAAVRDSIDHLYDVHDRLHMIDKRGKDELLKKLQTEALAQLTALNSTHWESSEKAQLHLLFGKALDAMREYNSDVRCTSEVARPCAARTPPALSAGRVASTEGREARPDSLGGMERTGVGVV